MNNNRYFLTRYLLLAAADIAAKGIGFLSTILIVRYLDAEGFGLVTFAGAFLTYALMFGTGGMDVYAVRHAAVLPTSLPSLATTLLILRLFTGLVVYAVLMYFVNVVPRLSESSGLFALFNLSLFTTAISLAWVPQATGHTFVLALNNICTQAFSFLILLGLFQFARDVRMAPVAQVVGELFASCVLLVWVKKKYGMGSPLPLRQWGPILSEAAPIGGDRIMRALALASDPVLLGFILPFQQVGWYGAAHKLFLLFVSLGGMYYLVWFPILAKSANESVEQVPALLQAALRQLLALSIVPVIIMLGFSEVILKLLFGTEFIEAAGSLRLLSIAVLLNLSMNVYRHALLARRRQNLAFHLAAISTGVHLLAKAILIPILGITGAALGTVLGEFTLLVTSWFAIHRGLPNKDQ